MCNLSDGTGNEVGVEKYAVEIRSFCHGKFLGHSDHGSLSGKLPLTCHGLKRVVSQIAEDH